MNSNPRVAIVIVSWNKKGYVLNLINSLKKIDYDNYEVIVVDNASTDGSVEAIRQQCLEIQLIVNSANLGGTGGFNTGMRYALEKGRYKYIWLLDNDAEVEKNTLNELIKVMEEDERIGIAGSRIIDTERKDVTVEAGAFFRWDTIDVRPLFRNTKDINTMTQVEEVGYVAICSAIVRADALNIVGLMDERFFIFWDDMDWGLQFKERGFKVVAVLNSVVYHPAFTEKRSPMMDWYYGIRNALLTYSKHTNFIKRIKIFFNYISYESRILVFLGISGRKDLMLMGAKGIGDFIVGKWGQKTLDNHPQKIYDIPSDFPKEIEKILILNSGSREEIWVALNKLSLVFPQADFTLLMTDDRSEIYNNGFQHIIKINSQKHSLFIYNLFMFLKILIMNYDIGVNPRYPSPFSYAIKRIYDFNPSTKEFIESKNNMKNIWKLIIAVLLGQIIGILLLPIVYTCSLKHGKS